MADKKPLAVRIVEALREHKQLTLAQLAKHADTTVSTLYTMMGTLKKLHGVARVGSQGKAAIYGFSVKGAPPQRKPKPPPKKPKKNAPARRVNGSAPYAAALLGLRGKRSELAVELEKVDGAIKAIEALAA